MQPLDPAIRKRLFVGLLLVVGLMFLLTAIRHLQKPDQAARPTLGLMTTLPLQWPEGTINAAVDSNATPAPAYSRLAESYRITAIDSMKQLATEKPDLLLLAQARALAPHEFVAIDTWVRDGGHVLILADPALQWESSYPIGDVRRPLFTSLLSPMLAHWGLELVLPVDESETVSIRQVGDLVLRMRTPGEWVPRPGDLGSNCTIGHKGLLADCTIGKGRALLIADADLLDATYWQGTGIRALSGSDDFANMRWIEQLLRNLKT